MEEEKGWGGSERLEREGSGNSSQKGVEQPSEPLIHVSNPHGSPGLETHHVHLPCKVVDALGLELLFLRNKLLATAFTRLVINFKHSTYAFHFT